MCVIHACTYFILKRYYTCTGISQLTTHNSCIIAGPVITVSVAQCCPSSILAVLHSASVWYSAIYQTHCSLRSTWTVVIQFIFPSNTVSNIITALLTGDTWWLLTINTTIWTSKAMIWTDCRYREYWTGFQ